MHCNDFLTSFLLRDWHNVVHFRCRHCTLFMDVFMRLLNGDVVAVLVLHDDVTVLLLHDV